MCVNNLENIFTGVLHDKSINVYDKDTFPNDQNKNVNI